MQFKQWILSETDWPLFLTEGEEQVLALTSSIIAAAHPGGNTFHPWPWPDTADELANDIKDLVELKYLPAFAFFLAKGRPRRRAFFGRANVRGYFDKLKILVDKGKIKWAKEGQATVKGVVIDDNKGNRKLVTDYLKFTEIIDGMYNLMKPSTRSGKNDARPDSDAKPIFSKNGLDIYESNSPQACIKYGEGYGFCISQPGGTMWQSYRDTQASTFYFVFDRTLDKSNPLHIVVVDMLRNGQTVTDANNRTGSIAEYETAEDYLNHLYGRGVPEDLFKNIPKTPAEAEENEKLGKAKIGLDFFRRLSYEEKSKYIGRGHILTDEQFDLLWENNTKDLLNQYINIGLKLNDYQAEKVLTKKDLKESYLRKRWIAYELGKPRFTGMMSELQESNHIAFFTVNSFSKLEFDNLKQEQQESIKKEIEINFDRVENAGWSHRIHDAFIKIYMTYEKGHHDIAELATRRLKKYAKESGNAKLLIARPLLGSDSFRDSIPFVHAIIKDVLVSDPLGYSVSGQEINNYLRKVLDAVVFNIPPHRSAKWDQIDMFEKRLKNNNWPGIWSGETQAAQIIDILVKAIISDRPGEPVVSVTTLDADLRRAMKDHRHFKELLPQSVPTPITRVGDHESRIKIAAFRTHYLEFLIRYLDGLASQTKDVS